MNQDTLLNDQATCLITTNHDKCVDHLITLTIHIVVLKYLPTQQQGLTKDGYRLNSSQNNIFMAM